MTIKIEEGKWYARADGSVHGPAEHKPAFYGDKFPWKVAGGAYTPDGRFFAFRPDDLNLVREVPDPTVEDDGFRTVEPKPESAQQVEVEAEKTYGWTEMGISIKIPKESPGPDIKATIADEAKRIVSGARRSAYGTPEQNFERIARLWQAYFENTDRADIKITARDVSPLMRLMKEARLCESPEHYDSFVDLIGYTLTGAEVNGVNKPA